MRCMIQHSRGALRDALACYEEALARVRQASSTAHAAAILNNVAYAYDSLGEPRAAMDRYEEAVTLLQELDASLSRLPEPRSWQPAATTSWWIRVTTTTAWPSVRRSHFSLTTVRCSAP